MAPVLPYSLVDRSGVPEDHGTYVLISPYRSVWTHLDSAVLVLNLVDDLRCSHGRRCSYAFPFPASPSNQSNVKAAIAGWFADRSASRRAPLLAGLALAFAATLISCFARAPWLLVIARLLQGLSASVIYTAGLALIADTVPAEEVGSWYIVSRTKGKRNRGLTFNVGWGSY